MSNARRNKGANSRDSRMATVTQLRAIQTQLNPNITGRPTRAQPRPAARQGDFWISRRLVIPKQFATTATNISLTIGDVIKEITTNGAVPHRYKTIRVYGPPNSTLTAALAIGVVANSVAGNSSNSQLTVTDGGTYTRYPAIEFLIPKLLSLVKNETSASTTVLCEVTAVANLSGNQPVTFEVSIDYQNP